MLKFNEPLNVKLAKNHSLLKEQDFILKQERDKAIKSEALIEQQNNELQLHNERLECLFQIAKYKTNSKRELLDYTLQQAIKITNSKIGYLYYYNEDTKLFKLNTWSKEVMSECQIMRQNIEYDLESTGCWGEVVRQRKPIIINDYSAPNKYKKGIPEGHVKMKNFMSIPIFINDQIVAVAGLANKKTDYTNNDAQQLTLLMDRAWKIIDRIELIEDLNLQKEKAEKADKLKSAFLANMSHEIRTPLNGLLGFTEILTTRKDLSEDLRAEYAGIVKQSGNNLLQIVNDILDISAIENNSLEIKKKTFNINSVLLRLYNSYSKKIKTTNPDVKLKFQNKYENIIINSDENRVVQILTNLLENALKFTHKGEIEFGIKQVTNDEISLFVKDSGIGINQEHQGIIFDRFRQAEISANRIYGGNGLGLSIVKELLILLDGNISLISEVNKGSAFYVTLPYKNDVGLKQTSKTSISKTLQEHNIQNTKILVIEDDEFNRLFVEEVLSDMDASITMVTNGIDGINEARRSSYDLILMDIRLPDINGLEVTKEIRKFNSQVHIIAQSAYAMASDKEEALRCGFSDYITKPIKPEVLLSKIAELTTK